MEENQSKYCYPDSDVLINKLDIRDGVHLIDIERVATTFRVSRLISEFKKYISSGCSLDNVNNSNLMVNIDYMYHHLFSVDTYLMIHKYIFGDIYEFAGVIRDEAINKSNEPFFSGKTPFCYPSFIFDNLTEYLDKMKRTCRVICSREQLLDFISYYYGEINVIHPFREGNGRTLRTFMSILVDYLSNNLNLNMELSYSKWDDDDRNNLLKATIICTKTGNSDGIRECFDKVLVDKPLKKKSR